MELISEVQKHFQQNTYKTAFELHNESLFAFSNNLNLTSLRERDESDSASYPDLDSDSDYKYILGTSGGESGESNGNLTELFGIGESDLRLDSGILNHSLTWTTIIAFAYAAAFFIGAVGNSMVVCVLLLRPQAHMKTVTNIFILNLSIADLLVNFFCVIPNLIVSILKPWVLGSFMCKALAYVQGVSVCASVYCLVAISMDRFLAIWFPMKMPRGLSKQQARLIIFFIWIMALSIYAPWLEVFTVVEQEGQKYCLEIWSSPAFGMLHFIIGNLILCYALPLMVVIILNGLIWFHVAKRKVPQESASPAAIKRVHRKTRHGVLRMLTAVTLAFLLSWILLYTISFICKIGLPLPDWLQMLIPFAQWLGNSNSSWNPILYAFLNKKFRDAFRSLITCPKSMNGRLANNTRNQFTGEIQSLNNSTASINVNVNVNPHSFSFRQRATFRYPIVRV